MAHANSFRDLDVYKLVRELAKSIFEISKKFPKEETYSLTDQLRRSSRSIGAQIAEAWGKRRFENYFISKLTDAIGEQQETEHWIECACDCCYLTEFDAKELLNGYTSVGKMLNTMINKSNQFCKN